MFCSNCGKELSDNAIMCPDCGEPTKNFYKKEKPVATEKNVIGLVGFIFSFIFPILGAVFSSIGYVKSKDLNGSFKGLSLAGIIVSFSCLILTLIIVFRYLIY